MDNSKRLRVIVAGMDGLTLDVIRPLAASGYLPNFKRIMEDGASGPLGSIPPYITAVAWPSMVTGANPGKHGLFDFVRRAPDFKLAPVRWNELRATPVWRILGEYGLKSVVINVPMTYPPEPLDGVMVSGMTTPNADSNFVWPSGLKPGIIKMAGDYRFDVTFPEMDAENEELIGKLESDLFELAEQRFNLVRRLSKRVDWDFLMFVVLESDRVQHAFWKYMDASHPKRKDGTQTAKRFAGTIHRFYRKLDGFLGELLESFDDDTVLIVASDHGHGPAYYRFDLPSWLVDNKYIGKGGGRNEFDLARISLETGEHSDVKISGSGEVKISVSSANAFGGVRQQLAVQDAGQVYCLRCDARASTDGILCELVNVDGTKESIIDSWEVYPEGQTVQSIFSPKPGEPTLALRMSSYGGYPTGELRVARPRIWRLCAANEVEAIPFVNGTSVKLNSKSPGLRGELAKLLGAERDAKTGQPIFERTCDARDIYSGHALADGPDILAILRQSPGFVNRYLIPLRNGISGGHRPDGVFFAIGTPIKKGAAISPNILDIAPTVLRLFGVDAPPEMDGRALVEILGQGTAMARKRRPAGAAACADAVGESAAEAGTAELEKRMRSLGYLG